MIFPAPAALNLQIIWAARHDVGPQWRHFAPALAAASLWHIESGQLWVEADGHSQCAGAGDWVWRAPGGARRMSVGADGARWNSVGIVALCGAKNWFAPPHSLIFRPGEAHQRGAFLLQFLIEDAALRPECNDLKRNGLARNDLQRDGLARALLGWLWSASGQAAAPQLPDWLDAALARIEAEPSVSVAQLARGAHFSPAQFRRLWQKHLGQSPRETLARRRLEMARARLETSAESVAQIAALTGFAGSAQLGRAFRATFGSAPLHWRRAARERV